MGDPFLDAARNGPRRQRQLLRKEKLAAEDPFSLLTARANGQPLSDPFPRLNYFRVYQASVPHCGTAEQGIAEEEALKKGLEAKSKEFVAKGAEVYSQA